MGEYVPAVEGHIHVTAQKVTPEQNVTAVSTFVYVF